MSGGAIWRLESGSKFEFASVDPWVITLGLIIGLVWKLKKNPTWEHLGLVGNVVHFTDGLYRHPLKSEKTGAWFLTFVLLGSLLAHCVRHWSLRTHGLDLSFIHQPLFYPWLDGVLLKSDFASSGTTLGDHLSLSLLILTPLTMWIQSDEWIFFLQIILIGGSFWVALRTGPIRDRKELYFFAVFLFIASRSLRGSLIWDFREDGIAFAALLLALVCLFRGRLVLYAVAIAVALLSKENVFLMTSLLGFSLFFIRDLPLSKSSRLWAGGLTILFSFIYGGVALKFMMPYFSGPKPPGPFVIRFGAYGSTPFEILLHILVSPEAWLQFLKQGIRIDVLRYLVTMLLPVMFFLKSKQALLWALPAVAGFATNVFLGVPSQVGMSYHYDLQLLPFLIFASWIGMSQIQNIRKPLLFACFIALALSGRWPLFFVTSQWPTRVQWQASSYLSSLPSQMEPLVSERVSAQVNHLARYRVVAVPEHLGEGLSKEQRSLVLAQWFQSQYPNVDDILLHRADPGAEALAEALMVSPYQAQDVSFSSEVLIFKRISK